MQNKYKNKKCTYDNIEFASIKERNFFIYLKQLEEKGEIWNLKLQDKIKAIINSVVVFEYRADFTYDDSRGHHVVDIKSEATCKLPVFRLKKKILKALYGIDIEVVL